MYDIVHELYVAEAGAFLNCGSPGAHLVTSRRFEVRNFRATHLDLSWNLEVNWKPFCGFGSVPTVVEPALEG